jgi:23S rRNA pseudouridine2605 synthase
MTTPATPDEPAPSDRELADPEHVDPPPAARLQKLLARAGLGSRRACEELIAEGRVTVDGEVARLGRRADPATQRIELDGVAVVVRSDLVYYLLNKPTGHVSTASDPQGRPTVTALVPDEPRVFPVGRLDTDTEGLLVLTNDGELTQLLTHPSHGVVKTYLAEVQGIPSAAALTALRDGVELDDGPTSPAAVRLVQRGRGTAAIELGIHEGRNRQVRRMCEAVGYPVKRLVRTKIGPVRDEHLRPGAWRELRRSEVRALYEAAGTATEVGPDVGANLGETAIDPG